MIDIRKEFIKQLNTLKMFSSSEEELNIINKLIMLTNKEKNIQRQIDLLTDKLLEINHKYFD